MAEYKYKYITVAETDKKDPETGKPLWTVKNNRSGELLGVLLYYQPWRMYIAQFNDSSVFSHDCLTDIADALKKTKGTNG